MTGGEKKKLRRAVWLLSADEGDGGDYIAGMKILLDLLGRDTLALEELLSLRTKSIDVLEEEP